MGVWEFQHNFSLIINFCWSTDASQCYVSVCSAVKLISHVYTYIPSF